MIKCTTLFSLFFYVLCVSSSEAKCSFNCKSNPLNYYSSFDSKPATSMSKQRTVDEAFSVINGKGIFTIKPGMVASKSDPINGTERAEIGVRIPENHRIFMSYDVKLANHNVSPIASRFMISQIKMESNPSKSPSVAVYINSGGKVKCVEYSKSASRGMLQHINSVLLLNGALDDGEWHTVETELLMDENNGYCKVTIDGKVQIEKRGYRTMPYSPKNKDFYARIGPYRDKAQSEITILYDNWSIKTQPINGD